MIVILGANFIQNFLNSIAHFIIIPEVSGFCRKCFSGWLVKTVILCSWKYE